MQTDYTRISYNINKQDKISRRIIKPQNNLLIKNVIVKRVNYDKKIY